MGRDLQGVTGFLWGGRARDRRLRARGARGRSRVVRAGVGGEAPGRGPGPALPVCAARCGPRGRIAPVVVSLRGETVKPAIITGCDPVCWPNGRKQRCRRAPGARRGVREPRLERRASLPRAACGVNCCKVIYEGRGGGSLCRCMLRELEKQVPLQLSFPRGIF